MSDRLLDDLIANWNDAAAPYGTINKWDVANDPTGVQDGEHHVSGTILGQDRSIAQVHDDWVTNPNSVAFVGWNRNAAGPEYTLAGRQPLSNGDLDCGGGECTARHGSIDSLSTGNGLFAAWIEEPDPDGTTALYFRQCPGSTLQCATIATQWNPAIGVAANLIISVPVGQVANPEVVAVPTEDPYGVVFPTPMVFHERFDGVQWSLWVSSQLCLGLPGPPPPWTHVQIDPPLALQNQRLGIVQNGVAGVAVLAGDVRVVWTETYMVGLETWQRIQTASMPRPGC